MIDINGDPALPLIICVTLDKSVPFQEKLFPAINNPWGFTQFPYAAKLPFSYISSPLTPHPAYVLPFHQSEADGEFMKCEVISFEMRKCKSLLITV